MSYEKKYKSYKEKYLKLKTQLDQNGGYRFNDGTKDKYMLSVALKQFDSYDDIFHIYPIDDPLPQKERGEYNKKILGMNIERLLSDEYSVLIEYFIRQYVDDTVYIQPFDDKTSSIQGVHPYHVNYGALMFMSFIFEYELFSLTCHLCKSNFVTYDSDGFIELEKNNNIKSIFNKKTTSGVTNIVDYRYYDKAIHKQPNILIKEFANKMETIFEEFMKTFVESYSIYMGSSIDEIYRKIVPVDYPLHKQNTYDFIYKNWKDRLGDVLDINTHLKETMNKILVGGTNYIAEATGFFSYMHLVHSVNDTEKFGSCITYTMIELYIMSRLHTHGDNMYVQLETVGPPYEEHPYWIQTANFLKMHCEYECEPHCCFTHWTSKFKLYGGDIQFRSLFGSNGSELQFSSQKDKIFYALILPIYDSYRQYLFNMHETHEYDENSIISIVNFLDKRIGFLTSFMDFHIMNGVPANLYYKTKMENTIATNIKIANPMALMDVISSLNSMYIPYLNFINMNQLCSFGESILYRTAVAGNYAFFTHMMKNHKITTNESKNIDELNVVIKNITGNDVLDGIIYSSDDKVEMFYAEGKILILSELLQYIKITEERRDYLIHQLETNPGLLSENVCHILRNFFVVMSY